MQEATGRASRVAELKSSLEATAAANASRKQRLQVSYYPSVFLCLPKLEPKVQMPRTANFPHRYEAAALIPLQRKCCKVLSCQKLGSGKQALVSPIQKAIITQRLFSWKLMSTRAQLHSL